MPIRVFPYRRQGRNSGRDNVFIKTDGKRHFLGTYDSTEPYKKYAKLIG